MKLDKYYLCVFESKNHAILIYTLLEAQGINVCQLVSTPCSIKAGCTYSIKISNMSYFNIIKREAIEANIKIPKVYFIERINGKNIYKEIDIN